MVRGFRALMIWFLSIWHGVSQKQLGARTGILDKRVSELLGRPAIKDEDFERLLAATRCKPAEVEIVTACLDGLQAAAANQVLTEKELEVVERGLREGARSLRHLLTDLAVETRWMPALDVYPRPADLAAARFHAGRQWEVLATMTEAEQLAVVRLNEDHHSWALMERVCDESEAQASRDVERAASLARVAQEIADRVQGPEGWRNAVRGHAAAHLPNALRVAGELQAARAGIEAAKQLWSAGSDPDRVLDPGKLLDLEASLCRDERQFEKALALLDEAWLVSRSPARILIKKAFVREVMGEYGRAIEILLQAEPLLDRHNEPRLDPLARELVKIFDAKGVHREALATLRLFHAAVQRDEATADIARRVLDFLFRARYDQGLRFTLSEGSGLAARVETDAGIGFGASTGIEPTAFIGRAAVGIEPKAFIGTPERRDEAPEPVPGSRLAGRRDEKQPGEDERGDRWAHRKVSCAAPASDHHGPRGPRLPDILRQEPAKNPGFPPVDGGMTWKNRVVRLVRALSGQSQKRFSETTGVDLRLLDRVEQGRWQPGTETLEPVTRRGYGLEVREAEEVLRFAESLRRPRQRTGQMVEILVDELAFLVSRVYQRMLRLPLESAFPGPEDPQHVETLWSLLKDLPEAEQRAVVKAGTKFQNWALVVRVCGESEIQASRDIEGAASLARLAQWIADLVPGPEWWRNRVRGLAASYGPNVLRVAGEHKAAQAGLGEAKRLWDAGADPASLLDPATLLDLEASLARDERRFESALALLKEALAVGRNKGRILVKKGFTLEVMGDYQGAVEALLEAAPYRPNCRSPPLVQAAGESRRLLRSHRPLPGGIRVGPAGQAGR